MATYEIVSQVDHPLKFAAFVRFNGGPAEYYEVDSLVPSEIGACLQRCADDHAAMGAAVVAAAVAKAAIVVVDGQIVVG